LGKQFGYRDGKKTYVALGPANQLAVVTWKTYEVEKCALVGQRSRHEFYGPTVLSSKMSQSDLRDFLRPCYQRDFL
jgi:hypothetical protein